MHKEQPYFNVDPELLAKAVAAAKAEQTVLAGECTAPRCDVGAAVESSDIEVLRMRIDQQARRAGGHLALRLSDTQLGDSILQVPAAPFLRWAAHNMSTASLDALPHWTPVCPPGMKQGGDNPVHTDWWLGAGLPLEAAYDRDHPANRAAWRFAVGLGRRQGHDCLRLAGEGTVFGRVVFPKANEPVEAGAIAVVPYAGVDYQMAMLTACKGGRGAVICATGGRLAHLATVGRETSCRVAVVEDAMESLIEGQFVTLDLDKLILERHDTLLDALEPAGG